MPLFRDAPPLAKITSSKNGTMKTAEGKEILDFMMGWCVGNAGWNKREILNAIKTFNGPIYVTPTLAYERWEELAKKLISLMPSNDRTCFRTTGGTEAVEVALKIARAYNQREKFMAFRDAYHGQSFLCMGLVDLHKDKFGPYPDWFIFLESDNWEKTTQQAVKLIKKKEVSAFISEPLICNKGIIIPPTSFFQAIQKACNETKTVFIIDEVATGFGRTGNWFGFNHHTIDPDIITIAKGFSSGYAAIGGVIAKTSIAESMRFPFSNYSTFGWHPVSVEAALASINYIEKNNLVKNAKNMGEYLRQTLAEFGTPEGEGLCMAIPCRKDIEQSCLEDGLSISYLAGRVLLFPPLDVTKKDIDKAITILKRHMQ